MISAEDLKQEIQNLRTGEQQALYDLIATRGAIQQCDRLLGLIEQRQSTDAHGAEQEAAH